MAGPRPGESGANFLRRLNQESYPYFQTPQADIQDMDEYDREALRNAAYYYMKNKEVMPEPKYFLPTNDPSINTGAELSALGMTNQGLGPLVNPDDYYRQVGMDEQAASSSQNISGTPLGRIDFGNGADTSLPQTIPTEAVMQFIGKLKTMGKDKVSKPYIGGFRPINPKDKPMNTGAPRRPESFDREDLERNDRMHDKAMRGGDDTLSYTETGDIVIPNKVAQANPGLTMAAMKTIADMGANPAQYVAGSPEGSYNPETGAQEFAWYDDIVKFGTKAADYIGSSDFGKAAATGALTYGGSKLMGNDSKTAQYQALGAGLGSYAGLKLDGVDPKQMNTKATGKGGVFEPEDFVTAAKSAAKTFGKSAMQGAGIGASIGTMMAPAPKMFGGNIATGPVAPMVMRPVTPLSEFKDQFPDNQSANLSATIPPPAPVAPMMPMALPHGVTYQDRVRDRDTGEYRFAGAGTPSDQSAFARALQGASRRRGFGNMVQM